MSSTHCSRATTALLLVAVLLTAVGTVSAISVTAEDVPSESQVGEDVTVSYTIDDPFTDVPNQWTLRGSTELTDVRWTVSVMRAGTQINEETYTEQTFNHSLDIDDNGDQVVVELDGTTPAVENYTYSPEETYLVTSLEQTTGSNSEELTNESAHHFTEESQEARNAIEDAQAAIDDVGGHEEAQAQLDRAISAYDNENWDNAVSLAGDAQTQAENAEQTRQTTNMLLMAGGALVVLALLGGGVYYWRSQQEEYSRL